MTSDIKETGLATVKTQNISIKIEIDTNPPEGAVIAKSILSRHRLISISHYDLPSLMVGKIHALITRKYGKGRDWYDLLWYRGQRPPVEPNMILLQNALDQTLGNGAMNASEWKRETMKKFKSLDCGKLKNDVKNFLKNQDEAELFSTDNFRTLLAVKEA
jgi:hypothetical protein